MHGNGVMKMAADGKTIYGRWIQGTLQGKSKIRHADGREEEATWRDGILIINKAKVVSEGRTWSAGIIFNASMVAICFGCGVGAYLVKDQATRRRLLTGAALMYLGQITESFLSS